MRKVLVYNNQTGLAEKMEPLFAGEGLQTAAASDTEELGMLLNDKEVLLMIPAILFPDLETERTIMWWQTAILWSFWQG